MRRRPRRSVPVRGPLSRAAALLDCAADGRTAKTTVRIGPARIRCAQTKLLPAAQAMITITAGGGVGTETHTESFRRTRSLGWWAWRGGADRFRRRRSCRRPLAEGVTHTAPSKYHDEIISLVFIHTKYGESYVIMVFRCAIQKVLCLTPPPLAARRRSCRGPARRVSTAAFSIHCN
jgi:hypothetical protein